MFPVAPPKAELPMDYADWLANLKQRIQQEQLRVILSSNTAMVRLYWKIGQGVLEKQKSQGWGLKSLTAWPLIYWKLFLK